MIKFRIDVLSYLLIAIAGACLIWFRGEVLWLDSEKTKAIATAVLCGFLVLIALYFGFEPSRDEANATKRLAKRLRWNSDQFAGSTQALLTEESDKAGETGHVAGLKDLRSRLQYEYGFRWRYRLPWLLLTGDDAAISRLLPTLGSEGWMLTADAVLLAAKPGADGQPDAAWLRQIYRLRRRRPVDAVVVVTDGNVALPVTGRGSGGWNIGLAHIAENLRWSAPHFVLEASLKDPVTGGKTPVVACEIPRQADASLVEAALLALRDQLSPRSVTQAIGNSDDRYLGYLSRKLDTRAKALSEWLSGLQSRKSSWLSVRGIVFAPYPVATMTPTVVADTIDASADLPLWQYLAGAAQRQPGRRTARHPLTIGAWLALSVVGIWTVGMLTSSLRNNHDIRIAHQSVQAFESATNPAARLKALDTLQQQILRYEYRVQHRAPLSTRFGLNRDADVLGALWTPYVKASREILVTPVVQNIEATLVDLSQLRTTSLSDETSKWAMEGHNTLKAYLMLAHPERVDAAFLAEQLAQHWTTSARITPGEKQDLAERFGRFYAEHLKGHPDWRIAARQELVAGARQTLLAVIGQRNAIDTIYQGILAGAGNKHPDQTLASLTLGTDPRGLLRGTALVPGVYTRQAYEGYVEAAIEQAARRRDVANDWVLTDGDLQQGMSESAGDLRAELRERYFADYAEHWQQFMNGLQWESAATVPVVVDQLKLMADARQSPVIAMMKSLEYHGGAGARKDSLADALVARTQGLMGKKDDAPEAATPDPAGPLAAAFGPVLRLAGQSTQPGAGSGDLSLQRFLDRATALRLRLQQVTNSADGDAQVRRMAQALFQGKGSELADTQAYAQLVAASLGTQWAGMGDVLFVRPIEQAMLAVLQPAQASLNDAWRQGVAMAWGRSFAGRYPFADTANDASLPELARFLRPQSGLISTFLTTHLAGVLELQGDEWVPSASGGQAVTFDPAFLKSINTLQRIANHMLSQGEPRYRFHFKPIPSPGLTDTLLTVDNQKLHYYNQRETWQAMRWPADNLQEPGTRLQWQTATAGTSKNYEFSGPWGMVRMLERARIEPIDSATFQLTWRASADTSEEPKATRGTSHTGDPESMNAWDARAPAAADMSYPVSYQLRTEVGHGPLEMLWLRDFVLPSRIFAGKGLAAGAMPTSRS
ncbi:MAG: type VI secretion protein VasK [Cupriavidus sp.]|nr:type VI secretion protein VasK [Cupriavidus sp.]